MSQNVAANPPDQGPPPLPPRKRMIRRSISGLNQRFPENSPLVQTLDGIPEIILVLNAEQQIVFVNQTTVDFLGVDQRHSLYGLRPGDVFSCTHAASTENGCGTSRACRMCGAAQAILNSLREIEDQREYRIIQTDGSALDLQATTKPLVIDGQQFVLCTFQDISHMNREMVLERLFFNDILNTAGLLKGYADIIDVATPEELEVIKTRLKPTATRLINEIEVQRLLTAAENEQLAVQWMSADTHTLLQELQLEYSHHEAATERLLQIAPDAQSLKFVTDSTLLGRVLSNLIKNALEASAPEEAVTLNCQREGDMVVFSVHNVAAIPRDIQIQIFQRSFSTKGKGYGIGAYSAKLLTERYLGGTLGFTSDAENGTTFTARYPLDPTKK